MMFSPTGQAPNDRPERTISLPSMGLERSRRAAGVDPAAARPLREQGCCSVGASHDIGMEAHRMNRTDPTQVSPSTPGSVTAINVLLEPDSTMLERSEANNARLLSVFPHGFALDAAHRPHITLLQRFVRTADLEEIFVAAEQSIAGVDVLGLRLEAYSYYYIPSGTIGLAGIVAKPDSTLRELQQNLIGTLARYTVATGDSDSFVTTPADPVIDPQLIEYVTHFVPESTGEQFNPHVTTGIASRDYLDSMLAEPFEPFSFSPAGAACYQLGQYGTAAKRLRGLSTRR